MWARLLFRVRRRIPDLGVALGSWRLSVVLMVLAALYQLLLAIWARSSPPHVVHNIAGLAPFWIVYAMLLVNTGVCLWRRLPALRRDLARSPVLTGSAPVWTVEIAGGETWIRSAGYAVGELPDGSTWGVKRRGARLGTYLFHGAFFLVALGFAVNMAGRRDAGVWVAVGEEFRGGEEQVLSGDPAVAAAVPPFAVREITPEYWRDELLFTRLEARLELAGGTERVTRINRPLWFGWGTFLRLSGFGLAPRFEVVDREGRVLDSAFVKLNVFPPGQRDHFALTRFPHRVYLQVLPDYVEGSEPPATASLNLRNPAMVVDVYRGSLLVASGLVRRGQALGFEGLELRFPETRYWGQFSVVRAPGIPLLFAGFLVALVGLAITLRGGRAEVVARVLRDGERVIEGYGAAVPPGAGGTRREGVR